MSATRTAADFLKEPVRYIVIANGPPGSGKSDLMMGFPRIYPITFDPLGLEFLKTTERGERLGANLAAYPVDFSGASDLDTMFSEDSQPGSIRGWLQEARRLAKAGEIATVGVDGLTYLGKQLRAWQEGQSKYLTKDGELNTIRMSMGISLWWSRFLLGELFPLCSRYGVNIVLTCHVKRESELAVEGGEFMKRKMKGKVQKDSDLAPLLEGGIKDEIGGMPAAIIYLDHMIGPVKTDKGDTVPGIRRLAYCDKTEAMDTTIQAKNRYGLPAKLNITNKSFYELLLKYSRGMRPAKQVTMKQQAGDEQIKTEAKGAD